MEATPLSQQSIKEKKRMVLKKRLLKQDDPPPLSKCHQEYLATSCISTSTSLPPPEEQKHSDNHEICTNRVHHSIYSLEMLIYTRSEELQRNAPLYLGLDPITKKPTKITTENAALLLPCPRRINDEMDYAELEFHLGLLGEYKVLRGPGEVKPHVIRVDKLYKKRTY